MKKPKVEQENERLASDLANAKAEIDWQVMKRSELQSQFLTASTDLRTTREESKLRNDKFVAERIRASSLEEALRLECARSEELHALLNRARKMIRVALEES